METRPKPVPLGTERVSPQPAEESSTGSTGNPVPGPGDQGQDLEERIIGVLRTCYAPEIPVNIYELGLIYRLEIDAENFVKVQMTLTSPGCPVAGSLPPEIEAKIKGVPGVKDAKVEVVWDPPWDKSMMSESAMLELGLF